MINPVDKDAHFFSSAWQIHINIKIAALSWLTIRVYIAIALTVCTYKGKYEYKSFQDYSWIPDLKADFPSASNSELGFFDLFSVYQDSWPSKH